MENRYFRAGVGTVIYNTRGEVALFERSKNPVGVWQFQQGGIDVGEDIETTLWRELREEVGLTKDDFSSVMLYPEWTIHEEAIAHSDTSKARFGQAHRWFFLALKDSSDIDLSRATHDESSAYRWTDFADAISETEGTKKHVYETLRDFFEREIRSTSNDHTATDDHRLRNS